jgi:DNA-binding MarR family transcriptional regulator
VRSLTSQSLNKVCNCNHTYTYHPDATFKSLLVGAVAKPTRKTMPISIDSPERRRLPLLLRRAWYGLNQAFRRRIAHLGITPDQFTVLRTLLEHAGATQRQLTGLISSDPNTVASLLERMEQAGLLERRSHETDRRANRLHALPLGKRKYQQAREIAIKLQSEALSVLPESDRETFLAHLDRVAATCSAAAECSSRRST